jgi:hypothetical protein
MIEKFWEKIGESLASEWDLHRLAPALAFWGGGLLIWVLKGNWGPFSRLFQLTAIQAGFLIVLLLVLVILSNILVGSLGLPLLRLFEGYWTLFPFNHLRLAITRQVASNWNRKFEGEYQDLATRFDQLNPVELQRYEHLEADLITGYPKRQNLFLPTRTGNLLRAAEEYPQHWYGLQAYLTWPRLWMLLPESTQKEISAARDNLDTSVLWLAWGILFSAWCGLTGWAVAISVLAAVLFARRMYTSAGVYGDLICAAYDLHRLDLYQSLGWPAPKTPEEEREQGEALTQFLRRRQTPAALEIQEPDQAESLASPAESQTKIER